jgi:DNA repair photolyase
VPVVRRSVGSRTVLTRTGITDYAYCVNPYVGCEHGCRYCYATFMKRFTGHREPWGAFVDAKANAPEVLRRQLRRAARGSVLVGSVTDPYQPLERRLRLTRGCLEALRDASFPVEVLTRSPLVLRDLDVLRAFDDVAVGLSIGTDREDVRRLLEPRAPPVAARIEALHALHREGVRTFAFVGPILPMDPARLVDAIGRAADDVLVDRLNYAGKVAETFRRAGLARYLEDGWFDACAAEVRRGFERLGVGVRVLF